MDSAKVQDSNFAVEDWANAWEKGYSGGWHLNFVHP